MKVGDLETQLLARSLALIIHQSARGCAWVVWLHAEDDPALGAFVGEGDTLEQAIGHAFEKWDEGRAVEVPGPTSPVPGSA